MKEIIKLSNKQLTIEEARECQQKFYKKHPEIKEWHEKIKDKLHTYEGKERDKGN